MSVRCVPTLTDMSHADIIAEGKRPMKMLAYLLAIICVIAALIYCVMPGGSLQTFMPGYDAGSTHIHTMHAAAVTAAVIFILIGLNRR
jgi:hypothetical protein